MTWACFKSLYLVCMSTQADEFKNEFYFLVRQTPPNGIFNINYNHPQYEGVPMNFLKLFMKIFFQYFNDIFVIHFPF